MVHIAIIVDGNGRWGIEHFGVRTKGHELATRNIWRLVRDLPPEVTHLTLYGLSIDNIKKRTKEEIEKLYQIFQDSFGKGLGRLMKKNIRLVYIGNGELPTSLRSCIQQVEWATKRNSGLVLSVALSYGSRDEIVRAASNLQRWNEPITMHNLESTLDTRGLPNIDLLIRTGGEKRLSDFLLWQIAYAELFFTDTLFPDFNISEFVEILEEYKTRNRRFGGVDG